MSVDGLGAEQYYIECGSHDVARVFDMVFKGGATTAETAGALCDDDGDVLDELSLNESQHYKKKVSKYLTTTLRCIGDVAFWYFMHSGNALRNPLLHFYAFLCTSESRSDFMVVRMVSDKLPEISAEFDGMCQDFIGHVAEAMQFASSILGSHPQVIDDDAWNDWITGSLAILLHNAASFDRRVTNYFRRCACQKKYFHGL